MSLLSRLFQTWSSCGYNTQFPQNWTLFLFAGWRLLHLALFLWCVSCLANPASGSLSACLDLGAGQHTLWQSAPSVLHALMTSSTQNRVQFLVQKGLLSHVYEHPHSATTSRVLTLSVSAPPFGAQAFFSLHAPTVSGANGSGLKSSITRFFFFLADYNRFAWSLFFNSSITWHVLEVVLP